MTLLNDFGIKSGLVKCEGKRLIMLSLRVMSYAKTYGVNASERPLIHSIKMDESLVLSSNLSKTVSFLSSSIPKNDMEPLVVVFLTVVNISSMNVI